MQALHSSHPSLPPAVPLLHSIFHRCNLRSPAVQGAPECIYGETHSITHRRTDARSTWSATPAFLPLATFFSFSCPRLVPAPLLLLHAPLLLSEGELLMTWRTQTAVPAAATGKVHGSPFSVDKNKNTWIILLQRVSSVFLSAKQRWYQFSIKWRGPVYRCDIL